MLEMHIFLASNTSKESEMFSSRTISFQHSQFLSVRS